MMFYPWRRASPVQNMGKKCQGEGWTILTFRNPNTWVFGELSKLFWVKCSDYLRPNRKQPPQQNSVDLISLAHCGLWAVRCNGRVKITKSLPITNNSTSRFAFPYSGQTYTEERQKVWKQRAGAVRVPCVWVPIPKELALTYGQLPGRFQKGSAFCFVFLIVYFVTCQSMLNTTLLKYIWEI